MYTEKEIIKDNHIRVFDNTIFCQHNRDIQTNLLIDKMINHTIHHVIC